MLLAAFGDAMGTSSFGGIKPRWVKPLYAVPSLPPPVAPLPEQRLTITQVQVNLIPGAESLIIHGKDFDLGEQLFVTLADTPLKIDLNFSELRNGVIVTPLPATLARPGDYHLVVSAGQERRQKAEFDLTIEEKPQGLPGTFCPQGSSVVGFNKSGNCVCSDGSTCQSP